MEIIDSQVHGFYRMDEREMIAAMDALGIGALVIDEVWHHLADSSSWPHHQFPNGARRALSPRAQAASLMNPERFAFLQRMSWRDPDLPALFSYLATMPGCKAVRVNVKAKADRDALSNGSFDAMFGLAQQHDLAVCMLIQGRNASDLVQRVAGAFPNVRFLLDHCGNPKSPEQWDEVLSLSGSPNVWLKWCHAHHCFDSGPYPYERLQSQLVRAIQAFGAERVVWASDVTHDRAGASWGDLLHYIRDSDLLTETQKEWVLAKSARAVFKWEQPVGKLDPVIETAREEHPK